MSLGTRHNINYWHVLPVPFAIPISGSWQHFHRAQRNSHRFASRNSAEITMYTVRKAFQQQRRLMCVQSPGCAWWHDLLAVGYLWVLSSHCPWHLWGGPKCPHPFVDRMARIWHGFEVCEGGSFSDDFGSSQITSSLQAAPANNTVYTFYFYKAGKTEEATQSCRAVTHFFFSLK